MKDGCDGGGGGGGGAKAGDDCSAARIAACMARVGGGPGELGGASGAEDLEGDRIRGRVAGGGGGAAGGAGALEAGGGGRENGIGGAEIGGIGGAAEGVESVLDALRVPGGGGGFFPIGGGGPRKLTVDAGRVLELEVLLTGEGRGGIMPGTGGAAELGIRGAEGRVDSGSDAYRESLFAKSVSRVLLY